jgi:predicted nucleic acid-binding Zn ribbon protein
VSHRGDNPGPQPVSKILAGVLRECGLSERLKERSPLLAWAEVVGEEIAQHSKATDISEGILIVEADHGAWRQELTLLIPMIIKKFNALFGEGTVTEIQWRNRPGQGRKRYSRK